MVFTLCFGYGVRTRSVDSLNGRFTKIVNRRAEVCNALPGWENAGPFIWVANELTIIEMRCEDSSRCRGSDNN